MKSMTIFVVNFFFLNQLYIKNQIKNAAAEGQQKPG